MVRKACQMQSEISTDLNAELTENIAASRNRATRRTVAKLTQSGQSVSKFLKEQAEAISDRAVFIIGFSQAGVARYIETDSPAGNAYLGLVTLSTCAAILAGFQLTTLTIALNHMDGAARDVFAIKVLHGGQLAFLAFLVAVISLQVAIVVMGYGTNFAIDSQITLIVGLLGLGATLYAMFRITVAFRAVKESPQHSKPSEEEADKHYIDRTLKQVSTVGNVATISR